MTKHIAALLVALVLALLLAVPAVAADVPPRVINVKVNHLGFNGQPNLTLTAEEDEMVELHLTYDDTSMPEDNPHQIAIEGTDIQSPVLDKQNPTAVLKFRAGNVGTTLTVACKLVCDGHDNLRATLRVVPFGTAGGATVQAQATQIKVTTRPPATPDGKAELHATVTDASGKPLEGMNVKFSVRTTFVIADWMNIGTARTNASGEAVLQFKPNRGGDQTIRGQYEGSGRYQPAEMSVNLAAGEINSTYAPSQTLHIPGFGYWILWLVLGVIWAMYVLVFVQLRQIAVNR